jgi:hypothetical protein
MTDATSHDIMSIDVEPDALVEDVPVDVLRSGLESDDEGVRRHAARVAAALSGDEIETAVDVVPQLTDLLGAESRVIASKSAIALSLVAEERPSELEDAVEPLVDLLVDDLDLLRVYASRALAHVSVEHPEFLLGTEETLVEALGIETEAPIDREKLREETPTADNFDTFDRYNVESERRQIAARGVAANLLVEIAVREPERLVPYAEHFVETLDSDRPTVVLASLDVLGQIARVDAEAVRPAVGPVSEYLEASDEQITAAAVATLGFIGDGQAVEPLRELAANDDRTQDLRELADETAQFIEQANA